jgi:hypothetical protein
MEKERCIKGFGGKIGGLGRPRRWSKDNIRTDMK